VKMKSIKIDMPVYVRVLVFLFLSVCFGSMVARADDVIVLKGSSARVSVDGIRKVTVANPAVIDAKPALDGQSVLVSGLTEGNSELRIERLQGADLVTNVVVRADLNGTLDQVKELLSDVEGLEIKTSGDKILLKGKIITKSDWERKNKVAGAYSGVILDLSEFDTSGTSGGLSAGDFERYRGGYRHCPRNGRYGYFGGCRIQRSRCDSRS
jgi:Flp pilus assembly secretin CpaC